MSWINRLLSSLRRNKLDDQLDEELQFHIEMRTREFIAEGMTPEEARYRARRLFGNQTLLKERTRDMDTFGWLETLGQDLRYALRVLRKTPAFTAVAVLSLALGIGANTAIFSAVYAALLKPLPYKDPDRLVFIRKKNPPRGWIRNPVSPAEILAWRNESGVFEDIAAFSSSSCVLTGGAEAEEDPCEISSSNLFPLLGVTPVRGRPFSAEEDKPEGSRVTVLSYGLWQRRFGGEESAIGRAITINGASYTITGVMSAGFSHLYATPYDKTPELWISGIALSPIHTWNDYFGVGRLKPGMTLEQAETRLAPVSIRLEQIQPELKGWRAEMMSLRRAVSGDTRPALIVLMGAVAFVLLIACANLANLLLARGAGRASEFAVRNALGATRSRLVRQLLIESLVISLAGGALGMWLASLGCQGLAALAPAYFLNSAPGLARGVADWRVLGFGLFATVATTFLFGLAPALQAARPQLAQALSDVGRSSMQSPRSRRLRSALVVAEIALAMVLLTGAGLMVRTLAGLSQLNLGFNPTNVLSLRVAFSGEQYKEPQSRIEFWLRVVAAVQTLPGVEAASVSRGLPIGDWAGQFFTTSDHPNPPAGQVPDANYIIAGPDYFRTTKIPLRRGRSFTQRDTQTAQRVAIVNEKLAQLYWPGENPLGKQLRIGSSDSTAPWLSVVGVAGNVLSQGPDVGSHAEIYIPYEQFPWLLDGPQHLLVRTSPSVKAESLTRAVVEEIHRVDKNEPAVDIQTLERAASEPMAQQRMVMALLLSFAGLALVLSVLGIYSVLSYSIAQRTREIGLRVALGADRGNVLRLVVGHGVRLALIGIALGVVGSLGLTRLMTDLLYGVRPTDPVTFVAVSVVLGTASLIACYVPARRAMNIDPIVALRYE
jgi:putative ABC transport system permease protein